VKHGGRAAGRVEVALRRGSGPGSAQVIITNPGRLSPPEGASEGFHSGLQLVAALMPRESARRSCRQQENCVVTTLELESPVVVIWQAVPA